MFRAALGCLFPIRSNGVFKWARAALHFYLVTLAAVPGASGSSAVSSVSTNAVVAPLPLSDSESIRRAVEAGDTLAAGGTLARHYCGACHLFPEPNLLDRKTWQKGTLPRMMIRMGLAPEYLEKHAEAEVLKASGKFVSSPMISEKEWNLIAGYYLKTAPEEPLPQDPRPPIQMGLRLFTPQRPKFRHPTPLTTLVKIDETRRKIYFGDAGLKTLDVLHADGSLSASTSVGNVPVALAEVGGSIYLTLIGNFLPSDIPRGEFALVQRTETGFQSPKVILKDLPRPTDAQFADLNGDGRTDFVLSMFGNNSGRLSWFENSGAESYREHVLMPIPGAVRTVIRDLNGDRLPDIAVLIAQELETMFFLINDGKGSFTSKPIFQKHPLFGHSYFEFADMNRDGRDDLLVTNGDNGEYASPTKKYHGVRIYLNRGDTRFEEAFFFPLNGAFRAIARDYDEDGDLDIAAISFFPDYLKSPEESFVFLENQGDLRFAAFGFREAISGRWLIFDCGDLDGDRDIDLVLGSYARGPSEAPERYVEIWENIGPSVLILKNNLR